MPFLVELALNVPSHDLSDEAVTVAARSLLDCYMALSSDLVFAKDVLRGSSVKVRPTLGGIGVGGSTEAEAPPLAGGCVRLGQARPCSGRTRMNTSEGRARFWHAGEAGIRTPLPLPGSCSTVS